MIEHPIKYRLLVDLPMLSKGDFLFDAYTAECFWYDKDGKLSEYPLRGGLAGYLWLLTTEKKYMRRLKLPKDS